MQPRFYTPQKITKAGAVLVAAGLLLGGLFIAAQAIFAVDTAYAENHTSPPACAFDEGDYDLVVDFREKIAPVSFGALPESVTSSDTGPLAPGTYTVKLHSWDDHPHQNQQEERWDLVLKNGSSEVAVVESRPEDDLADENGPHPDDGITTNTSEKTMTFEGVSVGQSVDTFIARHSVDHGTNSLWPICAAFEKEEPEEPEPKLAHLQVCKAVVDHEGDPISGEPTSRFTIKIGTTTLTDQVSHELSFETPLHLTSNKLSGVDGNDFQCTSKIELPLGDYHYFEEVIDDGSDWKAPKYNDQFTAPATDFDDFWTYGTNSDSDGEITLSKEGETRTLLVLNTLKDSDKQTPPTNPAQCPFTEADGTVITFSDEKIRSDQSESNAHTATVNTSLDSGNYRVQLYGYDQYSQRVNAVQPHEQWFLQFFNNSSLVTTSGTTTDLADEVETATSSDVVNTQLTIKQDIDGVRAHHAAYPDSNPNSVIPVCAAVKKVVDLNQCEDGIDNDQDGLIDAEDPGCHEDGDPDNDDSYDPDDDDETDTGDLPQCSDGVDNDNDGKIDMNDPGCDSPDDDDETDDNGGGGNGGNAAPVANADNVNMEKNTTATIDVLANDTDADGDALTIIDLTAPSSGTAATTTDDKVRYTPNSGFTGRDTFTYTIEDEHGATSSAVVAATVNEPTNGRGGGGGGTGGGGGGGGGFSLHITNESVQKGDTTGSAEVTWNTNTEATSQVAYGTSSVSFADDDEDNFGYTHITDEVDNDTEDHSVEITGLETGVTYYFRPVSDTDRTPEEVGDEVRLDLGEVLGTATPQQCNYLRDYLKMGWDNDRFEVLKLQSFLRAIEGFTNVELTGTFDQATFNAVEQFQMRYSDDVLNPWGYADNEPTGFVYYTTRKKINEIVCNRAFPLSAAQLEEVRHFRNQTGPYASFDGTGGMADLADQVDDTDDDVDDGDDIDLDDGVAGDNDDDDVAGTTTVADNGTTTATTTPRTPLESTAAAVYTSLNDIVEPVIDFIFSLPFLFFLLGVLVGIVISPYTRREPATTSAESETDSSSTGRQ